MRCENAGPTPGQSPWLGVALTGSDTSSNVLFGNLQQVTAKRLNLSLALMAASNSSGGVMHEVIVRSLGSRLYI